MFGTSPRSVPFKPLYDCLLIVGILMRRRPFLQEKKEETPRMKSFSAWLGRTAWCLLGLLVCAVLTVCLFKLAYPRPSYSLLAWLALVPFVWGIYPLRGFWRSVLYAWLVGTAVYAALYYWVFVTCWQGGGLSIQLAVAAWLGLSVLMALQFAIFGGSCFYLKQLKGFFPLVAAMGWVSLEWAHDMLATYVLGFPWFTLAYSQWNLPQVIQVAAVTGAAGVSFLVAFTGLSIGYAFVTPTYRDGLKHMLLAAVVFLATYGGGYVYMKHLPPNSLLRLHAAVMQPNIDQYKKWSPEFEVEIQDTLAQMSNQLAGKKDILVVWPESVTPGPVQQEPYAGWMARAAQVSDAWQLVGTNREENNHQYVSAFLLNPSGQTVGTYDKVHLVPFGEVIPFDETLRSLFPQIEVLGELGSFSAGKWQQPLLQLDQVAFGSTICYESVFPHLWAEQVRAGARFFVNITNDAWFFDTDAPYQHLAVSVLRGVEMRRPVLRAANTGISAVISSAGEILSSAPLNTRAILQADIALPLELEVSFYAKWGDWFAWLCVAIYMTVLVSALVFCWE